MDAEQAISLLGNRLIEYSKRNDRNERYVLEQQELVNALVLLYEENQEDKRAARHEEQLIKLLGLPDGLRHVPVEMLEKAEEEKQFVPAKYYPVYGDLTEEISKRLKIPLLVKRWRLLETRIYEGRKRSGLAKRILDEMDAKTKLQKTMDGDKGFEALVSQLAPKFPTYRDEIDYYDEQLRREGYPGI